MIGHPSTRTPRATPPIRRSRRRTTVLLGGTGLLVAVLAAFLLLREEPQRLGMHLHVLWTEVSDAEADRQLDRAAAAGATLLRVDVGWSTLEGEAKGRRDPEYLRRLDRLVDAAEERELELLLAFSDTPCWASSAPEALRRGCRGRWWERDVQRYLPTRPADYADALGFLAGRYGERVAAWEVWNEPNLDYFSRGPDKAGRYAELVRAAYPAAKAAAPEVPVLAGALAESDVPFTRALYRAGIRGSFDGFSIHPYSHDASPVATREPRFAQQSFVRGVPAIRRVMLGEGDDKPLWLTEFGWSTIGVRGPRPWENGVDEARQARYVREALQKVREWDYVPAIVYYSQRDRGASPSELIDHYGLVRADGTPKPALAAFSDAASGG